MVAHLSAFPSELIDLLQDIIIAETDWAESCSGVSMSEPSIPISASGQSTWVGDIRNVLNNVPNGHGKGIIYWEPGWIGNANLGSGCSVSQMPRARVSILICCVRFKDALLVDSGGTVRSSISMFNSDM